MESKQEVTNTRLGAMQLLAECHAARIFQGGSARSAQLLLIPMTIVQVSEVEIREAFFARKTAGDLETICRMAVH